LHGSALAADFGKAFGDGVFLSDLSEVARGT